MSVLLHYNIAGDYCYDTERGCPVPCIVVGDKHFHLKLLYSETHLSDFSIVASNYIITK